METFAFCLKCGKMVIKNKNDAYLSLCLGSVRLASLCFCDKCGKTVAKQMVNDMFGMNLPVSVEERINTNGE